MGSFTLNVYHCLLSCLPPLNVISTIEINGTHLVTNTVTDANADTQCERTLMKPPVFHDW